MFFIFSYSVFLTNTVKVFQAMVAKCTGVSVLLVSTENSGGLAKLLSVHNELQYSNEL